MKLEIYSFYGSTEIGSMAGECQKHEGIHVFNDAVVPTLIDPVEQGNNWVGQVAWTTLHFSDQPLIKYVNGDIVATRKDSCSCGYGSPLMTSVSRKDDIFVIYGQKFRYEDFLQAITKEFGPIDILKLIITSGSKCDKVVFQVPRDLAKERAAIVRAIASVEDFAYFLEMGFVSCDVEPGAHIGDVKRKIARVVDYREFLPEQRSLSPVSFSIAINY